MYRIIDERGSGKTSRLMLLAKKTGGVIVCSNPRAMEEKARAYGIDGVQFMDYGEFTNSYNKHMRYYIDEVEAFLKYCFGQNLEGYTLSLED